MNAPCTVVFGTSVLAADAPVYPGQPPAHVERFRGRILASYSTGRLEEALRRGCAVFVCSIRFAFGPHDQWWQELVDPANVFCNDRLLESVLGSHREIDDALMDSWRRLYERLGLPWCDDFRRCDDANIALIVRHGVLDGSLIKGY